VNLTGLYFPLTEARCRFVGVPVVVSDMGLMFPVPEAGILPPTPTGFTRILRPSHIRTCDRTNGSRLNRTDTFMVYYRYDESMMRNISLANLDSNICWRGEVIIMKVGVRGQLVKMASSRDSKRIARFIMTEYKPFSPLSF